MIDSKDLNDKPLVGFFPCFPGIGETYPLIKIARSYREFGGEVVFFSHGGEYEYMAKEIGCDVIRVDPVASGGIIERYFLEHDDEDILEMVRAEALIYRNAGIKALVHTSSYFDCILASRLAGIPLISIISGTLSPPYFKANYATFPDDYENFFTQFLPSGFKNHFIKWYILSHKSKLEKKFNCVAKKLDIDIRFGSVQDLMLGDYTLLCDDIDFLGLKPTKDFPSENYVGPILTEDLFEHNADKGDAEIENHIKRSERSILISMGSAYDTKLFLRLLKILNLTKYNVVVIYTSRLDEKEFPEFNDNILLKKFVSSTKKLHEMIDLAVIHGGRGTVYTAAYSAKPVIGIPNIHEQQCNLDCLVRHGTAIRLSKKYFKDKDFLDAIDEIFANYDFYLKNAERLANKLPLPEGDKNAAKRIFEILKK